MFAFFSEHNFDISHGKDDPLHLSDILPKNWIYVKMRPHKMAGKNDLNITKIQTRIYVKFSLILNMTTLLWHDKTDEDLYNFNQYVYGF